MPLIRYRTRDLCTLDRSPCACGRTHARMGKLVGRTDDMLIIRGVNVFPSQVETALLELGYASPNYRLVVERTGNADRLDIEVELSPDKFSDEVRKLENMREEIAHSVHSITGLNAGIKLVEQGTIPRSEGKAARVLDKRKL